MKTPENFRGFLLGTKYEKERKVTKGGIGFGAGKISGKSFLLGTKYERARKVTKGIYCFRKLSYFVSFALFRISYPLC